MKRTLSILGFGIAVLAAMESAWAQTSSCSIGEQSTQFTYTGAEQTFTVPPGASTLKVYIDGAQGGSGGGGFAGAGGLGGRVSGQMSVSPGQTLSIFVGGQGTVFNGSAAGGNAGGGIGGGASDIRVGGNAIANRVAVAGGGGGGGTTGCTQAGGQIIPAGAGGLGGGGAGSAGTNSPSGGGGAGGTVGAGGAAGIGCGGFLGQAGQASGVGGDGQSCCCPGQPAGGGGGGGATVGGGGGGGSAGTTGCQFNDKGGGGGGAGGTSAATGLTAASITNGVRAGDGLVEICVVSAAVVVTPTAVPATTDWALALLAAALLLLGGWALRRARAG